MDHSLRSISYIADIGDLLVIMARRRIMPQDGEEIQVIGSTPKMICHVFESEEVRTYNIMIRDRILCFFNEETLPEFMIGIVVSECYFYPEKEFSTYFSMIRVNHRR